MPLLHCKKCHHEWEDSFVDSKCSWCSGESYMLEKETAFEKACKKLCSECTCEGILDKIKEALDGRDDS